MDLQIVCADNVSQTENW